MNITQTISSIEKTKDTFPAKSDITFVILLSAAGSQRLAESLKTTDVAKMLISGPADIEITAKIPVIPTAFFIIKNPDKTDSADSDNTLPTRGINVHIAYFNVLDKAPA